MQVVALTSHRLLLHPPDLISVSSIILGANVELADEIGHTLLYRSLQSCNGPMKKCFLNSGADISVCDRIGCSAIHHAASSGRGPELQTLLRLGASLITADKAGWTSMHWAARRV